MNNLEYYGLQEEYRLARNEMSREDMYRLIDELLATEDELLTELHKSRKDRNAD